MEFDLSESQHMLQQTLERFFADKLPVGGDADKLRSILEGRDDAKSLEAGLRELGLDKIMLPESVGGLDGSLLDAACAQEIIGRYAAPLSFMTQHVLVPLAIKRAASPEQAQTWFSAIANGTMRCALALPEEAQAIQEQNGALSGRSAFAFAGTNPTHILSAAGGHVWMHKIDDAGIERKARQTIDKSRDLAIFEFAGAKGERLAGENAPAALPRLLGAARILLAADMVGAASMMVERAVAYAKEREQFGRVIGSFQAVKHLCAEAAAALEPCRALFWYAAYQFDSDGEDWEQLACLTKAHSAEAAHEAARKSTEVYGGAGFADFTGLHFWFKRVGAGRQLLGNPDRLFEEAAQRQGWTS